MNNKAFTLIELSVVIIIIGLIVAGIVAGQSLIKQIALKSITVENNKFSTAFNSFKLQHDYFPGDFPNAYDLWEASSGLADCDDNSTNTGCNGDGDGLVSWNNETFKIWEHLFLAGLYQKHYLGEPASPAYKYDTAMPRSKHTANKTSYFVGTAWYYNLGTHNAFVVMGLRDTETWPNVAALSAREAKAIDDKIDDGIPTNGKVASLDGDIATSPYSRLNTCANISWSSTSHSTYQLSAGDEPACIVVFYH